MADNNGPPSGFIASYLDDDPFNPNANNNNNNDVDDVAAFEPLISYLNGEDFSMFPPPPNPVGENGMYPPPPNPVGENGNADGDGVDDLFGDAPQEPQPAPQPAAPVQQNALAFPKIDPSLQGEHIEDEIVVAGSGSPAPAAPQGHQDHFANLNPFTGNQAPRIDPNQQYQNPFDLNQQFQQHQAQNPLGHLAAQGNNTHNLYGMPVPPHQPSHGQFGPYSNMQGLQQQQFPAQGLYWNHHGPQFPAPSPPNLYRPHTPSPNPYQSQSPSPSTYQPSSSPSLYRGSPSPNPPAQFKIHHKRGRKDDANNDPTQIYAKPGPLGSWGSDIADPNVKLFQYYQRTAELRSGIVLTRDQIAVFLLGHGHLNPAGRRLTLWIQNTAAQSNDRYANGSASSKCRYKDCPGQQNTILKGFYRVAFDEFSDRTGSTFDPMHNAFYMHLHCFEDLFDLGFLIHHGARYLRFQVRADTRDFAHESRNPASINRDYDRMVDTYNEWVDGRKDRADAIDRRISGSAQGQWYTGLSPPPENILPHPQRLGYALTVKHLDTEHRARADARNKRGGVHIGVHMGDLAKLVRLKKQQRDVNRAVDDDGEQWSGSSRVASPQPIARKRRAADETDDGPETRAAKRNKQTHTYIHFGDFGDTNPQPQVSATSPMVVTNQGQAGRKRGADDDEDNDPFVESSAAPAKRSKQTHNYSNPLLRAPPYLPPPPNTQRAQPYGPAAHRQLNPTEEEMCDIYGVSSDDEYRPAPPRRQRAAIPNRGRAPRTRQRSREIGSNILGQLQQQAHLTRSSAHVIQSRLGGEPAHVQDQVLASVPEEYAELVAPPQQQQPLPLLYPPVPPVPDHLEARVEKLGRAQRREVVGAVAREEKRARVMGPKQRKVQSL